MLHGRLLRSRHAHAELVSIDASAALALPGVRGVITGKDLPARYGILPVSQDEAALAQGRVRYVGEPVAAVAADDEATAQEALERISVVYRVRPACLTIDAAASESAPAEGEGRLHKAISYEFGSRPADAPALERSDLFFYEGNTHLPLEEHAALAVWEGETLILRCSSQTPFHLRQIVAKVFGMPEERVRVIVPSLGGGFGGKLDPFSHDLCAAELARRLGRPVKFALTREEVFYCHRGRHPSLMRVASAWTKDGRLLDLDFEACLDGGAYGSFGVVCTYYHGALQPTTYKLPRYAFRAARFTTNKPPCGPKRGHGIPQPRFALEVHLDKVAVELGVDPIDLRLKNLTDPDSVTVNKLKLGSNGLRACVGEVARASDFRRRRGRLGRGRGLGFALGSYLSGAGVPIYWNDGPHSRIRIEATLDGRLTLYSGATDIGQGSDTVVVTVAAEVLGLPLERIRLVAADTALTPLDLGSYSSRVTFMAGNAAKQAAENLKAEVERLGGAGKPFEAALRAALKKRAPIEAWGAYTPPKRLGKFKGAGVGVSPAYSFSACVAEVSCDPETGRVSVEKIHFAHDIGRALNRASVLGQVEGGIHMGLGEALTEEQTYHANGLHRRPSMLDYKVPGIFEMPELDIRLVESQDAGGPYGAKEVGQGPLIPVVPAIANAIYDAVGVRIDSTPFTAEKVLAALDAKARGGAGRVGPERLPDVPFPEPIRVTDELEAAA
ncbi:MAG: molybdopterin-dependent oxidoreductase [Elusimicrobia bacterium]|nr:molybdopterin-dependent oxidoreductase [Elusimicrobiota bacterium]